MTPRLDARHVTVRRGGRAILTSASIALAPGTLTAIVGPNGGGKSTLLRVLAGLWAPSAGEVSLDGVALGTVPRRDIARRVTFLPQDTRCDFAFTVGEMVAIGRHPHRGRFAREARADRDAIERAIALCDLDHLRHRTVDRLSGGERQRVAIARCLATEPDVVLLDEPTAHLDLAHALAILGLCRALARDGRAVALATHDIGALARVADAVVVLHQGRVVADGVPGDVLSPVVCREVFGVEADVASTAEGVQTLVFSPSRREAPAQRRA